MLGKVKMREADCAEKDFYLLEELSKPNAHLSASKITLWIYYDYSINNSFIREIVLSGHAESQTCSSVTSILIEGLKGLNDNVEYMLTCGAAYFRVKTYPYNFSYGTSGNLYPNASAHLTDIQNYTQFILHEMVMNLKKRAEETGLVEIFEIEWEAINNFRAKYYKKGKNQNPRVNLPNTKHTPLIADYVPIYPYMDKSKQHLVLKLEGWEYDDSEFETVADIHFQKMQQELLKDARRRMRKYREWLKEWMENWVRWLHFLPKSEADSIMLNVPPPIESKNRGDEQVGVINFLTNRISEFLDKGQRWYWDALQIYNIIKFNQYSSVELDTVRTADKVVDIDFERGRMYAKNEKREFTWRQRIKENEPSLISTCLKYIRRMEYIIKPYQEMKYWRRGAIDPKKLDPERRGIYLLEQLSKKIVLETMIRG